MEHWRHNDLGFFNTSDDAWSIVPPHTKDFRLFAYAIVPMRFVPAGEEPLEITVHDVEPLPTSFVSLGFDVVNKTFSAFFECSPLTCNGMADEVPVNRFCLLGTLTEAITFAQRCAREEPESGPFYVIEVFRGSS